ncbi:uncharacterized protein SPPG_07997 [Spizellomyces punctatus DAOM BR117]|uniref:Uncharacterized protein n=1 Tax=Spizellomyces punctatus (strain DAOM BR117) TaxID=645134 RepID=A0A0L0H7X4_SPIPD|nr:uncharacterized protein SPPG_07997 [Spizellomyces punctatus DAOM BR117]KNC96793.1 hypothetical protein SPPG_07997 [Spizellomyces punctatus DAOM BR117]|eukprot:XP_016604833.1 hypothetical protein SPPG_07997 [Spizellomyces punctatus DAOM BR117]
MLGSGRRWDAKANASLRKANTSRSQSGHTDNYAAQDQLHRQSLSPLASGQPSRASVALGTRPTHLVSPPRETTDSQYHVLSTPYQGTGSCASTSSPCDSAMKDPSGIVATQATMPDTPARNTRSKSCIKERDIHDLMLRDAQHTRKGGPKTSNKTSTKDKDKSIIDEGHSKPINSTEANHARTSQTIIAPTTTECAYNATETVHTLATTETRTVEETPGTNLSRILGGMALASVQKSGTHAARPGSAPASRPAETPLSRRIGSTRPTTPGGPTPRSSLADAFGTMGLRTPGSYTGNYRFTRDADRTPHRNRTPILDASSPFNTGNITRSVTSASMKKLFPSDPRPRTGSAPKKSGMLFSGKSIPEKFAPSLQSVPSSARRKLIDELKACSPATSSTPVSPSRQRPPRPPTSALGTPSSTMTDNPFLVESPGDSSPFVLEGTTTPVTPSNHGKERAEVVTPPDQIRDPSLTPIPPTPMVPRSCHTPVDDHLPDSPTSVVTRSIKKPRGWRSGSPARWHNDEKQHTDDVDKGSQRMWPNTKRDIRGYKTAPSSSSAAFPKGIFAPESSPTPGPNVESKYSPDSKSPRSGEKRQHVEEPDPKTTKMGRHDMRRYTDVPKHHDFDISDSSDEDSDQEIYNQYNGNVNVFMVTHLPTPHLPECYESVDFWNKENKDVISRIFTPLDPTRTVLGELSLNSFAEYNVRDSDEPVTVDCEYADKQSITPSRKLSSPSPTGRTALTCKSHYRYLSKSHGVYLVEERRASLPVAFGSSSPRFAYPYCPREPSPLKQTLSIRREFVRRTPSKSDPIPPVPGTPIDSDESRSGSASTLQKSPNISAGTSLKHVNTDSSRSPSPIKNHSKHPRSPTLDIVKRAHTPTQSPYPKKHRPNSPSPIRTPRRAARDPWK